MKNRLNARLRQHRDEAQPDPVYIEFDPFALTSGEAIAAAIRSGNVPQGAALFVSPRRAKSREEWERYVRHVQAEHERQQQSTQAGAVPAETHKP